VRDVVRRDTSETYNTSRGYEKPLGKEGAENFDVG
jgi:hypothetical protein